MYIYISLNRKLSTSSCPELESWMPML